MRIFKTRLFAKWANKEKLEDALLRQTINEMEKGLLGAKLGNHVYKKRVALKGRGKQGSTRSIIAYKIADKAFFIFGYAKNEKENITAEEKKIIRRFAAELLSYSDKELDRLIESKAIVEVRYDG